MKLLVLLGTSSWLMGTAKCCWRNASTLYKMTQVEMQESMTSFTDQIGGLESGGVLVR